MLVCTLPAGASSSDLHEYLKTVLYKGLLNNSAVAGIKLGVHWCLIQPYHYDWSYLDDVFAAVAENKGGKTVQLSITPGFDSTTIGFGHIMGSCDTLFWPGNWSEPNCYYVTFWKFPEQQNADSYALPLPWISTYNTSWGTFLQDLGKRINARPDYKAAMVAIVVAGPVGASTEMILPSSLNSKIWVTNNRNFGYQEDVDTAWGILIHNSYSDPTSTYASYPGQVFIDFWTTTIQAFETAFSGIKLIVTADSGRPSDMPNLAIQDNPTQLAPDCQGNPSVSCAAAGLTSRIPVRSTT